MDALSQRFVDHVESHVGTLAARRSGWWTAYALRTALHAGPAEMERLAGALTASPLRFAGVLSTLDRQDPLLLSVLAGGRAVADLSGAPSPASHQASPALAHLAAHAARRHWDRCRLEPVSAKRQGGRWASARTTLRSGAYASQIDVLERTYGVGCAAEREAALGRPVSVVPSAGWQPRVPLSGYVSERWAGLRAGAVAEAAPPGPDTAAPAARAHRRPRGRFIARGPGRVDQLAAARFSPRVAASRLILRHRLKRALQAGPLATRRFLEGVAANPRRAAAAVRARLDPALTAAALGSDAVADLLAGRVRPVSGSLGRLHMQLQGRDLAALGAVRGAVADGSRDRVAVGDRRADALGGGLQGDPEFQPLVNAYVNRVWSAGTHVPAWNAEARPDASGRRDGNVYGAWRARRAAAVDPAATRAQLAERFAPAARPDLETHRVAGAPPPDWTAPSVVVEPSPVPAVAPDFFSGTSGPEREIVPPVPASASPPRPSPGDSPVPAVQMVVPPEALRCPAAGDVLDRFDVEPRADGSWAITGDALIRSITPQPDGGYLCTFHDSVDLQVVPPYAVGVAAGRAHRHLTDPQVLAGVADVDARAHSETAASRLARHALDGSAPFQRARDVGGAALPVVHCSAGSVKLSALDEDFLRAAAIRLGHGSSLVFATREEIEVAGGAVRPDAEPVVVHGERVYSARPFGANGRVDPSTDPVTFRVRAPLPLYHVATATDPRPGFPARTDDSPLSGLAVDDIARSIGVLVVGGAAGTVTLGYRPAVPVVGGARGAILLGEDAAAPAANRNTLVLGAVADVLVLPRLRGAREDSLPPPPRQDLFSSDPARREAEVQYVRAVVIDRLAARAGVPYSPPVGIIRGGFEFGTILNTPRAPALHLEADRLVSWVADGARDRLQARVAERDSALAPDVRPASSRQAPEAASAPEPERGYR